MNWTLGFLGCGNMGQALLSGWLEHGEITADRVLIAAKTTSEATAQRLSVRSGTLQEVVDSSDLIILAVKPQYALDVVSPLSFRSNQLVVSIMAGTPISRMGVEPARVVRTMPNVGSRVGLGATVAFAGSDVTAEEKSRVDSLFNAVGCLEWLGDEDQFHAATALVGSGPAYVFMALEAMAAGAVAAGLPSTSVHRLAAATVEGAAALALRSGEAPGVLKDRVASPGGTTVAALRRLEHHDFSGALTDAIDAAAQRSRELAMGET